MSIPYFYVNSMTYSSSTRVLTLDTGYQYLRGGGSFSITGLSSSTLYYGTLNSYDTSDTYTFSVSLPSSTTFNTTINFYKGVINNYSFDAGFSIGMTGSPGNPTSTVQTLNNGGMPVNLGYVGPSTQTYETSRSITYTFRT